MFHNMIPYKLGLKSFAKTGTVPIALAFALALAGCAEVVEWFDGERYSTSPASDVSDIDYCQRIALATLHAEGEISTDIGGELESGRVGQGPNTLERNVGAYAEQQRYQRIMSECLRNRADRRLGTNR